MKQLTILTTIILLTSCQAIKDRRCQRHYRLSEACRTTDTLFISDTIKGFITDTFVKYSERNTIDTLIVDSGGIKVVTFIKWKDREINQVVTKRYKIINRVVVRDCPKCPPAQKWWDRLWIGVWIGFWIGLLVFALIFKLLLMSIKFEDTDNNTH